MRISPDEVRRIAELAQLELEDAAVGAMAADLSRIIDYVEQLPVIDGDPTTDSETTEPLREDVVARSLAVDEVAANAPQFRDGFFVVPRVIGGE